MASYDEILKGLPPAAPWEEPQTMFKVPLPAGGATGEFTGEPVVATCQHCTAPATIDELLDCEVEEGECYNCGWTAQEFYALKKGNRR